MKSIYNEKNIDTSKQPIFFGEELGLQRLDRLKYPKFYTLYKDQLSFMWRPNEISLVKDAADYKLLTPNEQFIFSSNLKFQTLMDSCISRGVGVLLPYVSLPEVEYCCKVWEMFECIHSESYNYIIENVYPDYSAELDSIADNEEIMKRGRKVKEWYDKLLNVKEENKYETMYKAVISINILEAVQFFVSFVCSFAFANNKMMVGDANIIKLIRRDENKHLQITLTMLKAMRTNKDEGFLDIINDTKEDVKGMFVQAVDEEKAWAKYLFQNGSLLGLNENILGAYIEWVTNTRLKAIGMEEIYPSSKNPMSGWLDSWMGVDTQTAPQEDEETAYKIGQSVNDLKGMNFKEMEL